LFRFGPVAVAFLVGGQVTGSPAPFYRRIGKGVAVTVPIGAQDTVTALTGLHHGAALAAVERTAFLGHKRAIDTRFDAFTVHGDQPPFSIKSKLIYIIFFRCQYPVEYFLVRPDFLSPFSKIVEKPFLLSS
jgi:hypothetical protein